MHISDPVFLTASQTARLLNTTERTLERWRRADYGPPYLRLGKRRVGYRQQDVESWAAGRTFAGRTEERAPRPIPHGTTADQHAT